MSSISYRFARQGLACDYRDGSYASSYVLCALDDETIEDDEGRTRAARLIATIARYSTPPADTPPVVRRVVVPHAQWGAARRCLAEARTRPDWDRAWATVREMDGGGGDGDDTGTTGGRTTS